ncbi:DUF4159 domain-containing protein [Aliiroseovarius sp. YM-037]|uniref:DUF4159 domain-containing protein n=1 Tax=Aliiroseovarius sp. YM-037 TaxID=3341728 RepID=UPI003A80C090
MTWTVPFLGPVGFVTPLLLWALVILPILWLLLRAVPPAPIRRLFPGVILLLGLTDDDSQSDKTPWWLLLLRMLAIAAVIVGFAGPVLNPQDETEGSGPLMVVLDGTWADAADWEARIDRVDGVLSEASRAGRTAAVTVLTSPDAGGPAFQSADVWVGRLAGLQPAPHEPDAEVVGQWIDTLGDAEFDTLWLSDGLDRDSRDVVLDALEQRGSVTIVESGRPIYGIRPARFSDGLVRIEATRIGATTAADVGVSAIGLDPAGQERQLARGTLSFGPGRTEAELPLNMPPELRNRVNRFALVGQASAGAVSLTDDGLRRREIALIAGRGQREGLELLSPLHFLEKALEPTADLIDGALADILLANPDVIVLADVATMTDTETRDIAEWVANGGMLLRFAGPQLAASDVSRDVEDILMPVRLRRGGRSVGGAMSWGEPKELLPFAEDSPFYGLTVPDEVVVSSQVVAQPDPELANRSIAALADGTPLVTRKRLGDGQVVLFHVTANADWSTLPISGLFVEMLERLAVSTRQTALSPEDMEGTTWVPTRVIDAFGELAEVGGLAGVAGERLAAGVPGPGMPPGLYAGGEQSIAVNVIDADTALSAASWPARLRVEGLTMARETPLKGAFLLAALGFLLIDVFASLWLTGRFTGPRTATAASVVIALMFAMPQGADAQTDDEFAIAATSEVVLGHVITGDPEVDRIANAGLRGLGQTLIQRTSIEPAEPMPIDLETDELSFFPLLYWPITRDQPLPSDEAYAKLNRFLRNGGMILFDTRDAGLGSAASNGEVLQRLARPLDIPPLERVPSDHVLTRTFYLLQDFPGRYKSRDVWVEAAPPNAEQVEGMPFRNLNDGVTPVVIGGNDWASAWAIDANGSRMFPVGRGYAGERQREISLRFGVNLLMHVLTGNYKSDQVHVPALLDRLGQ